MVDAYLTIDDSPSEDMERKVDFLSTENIPAVFFCEGRYLEERPEAAVRAVQKGFVIGNHGYSHTVFSEMSLEECREEIEKTDELVEEVYSRAGKDRKVKAFRFPFGDRIDSDSDKFRKIQEFLSSLGYTGPGLPVSYDWWREKHSGSHDWFWTFDVKEHELDTVEEVLKRIAGSERLEDGSSPDIVLIHDHVETSDTFIPAIKKMQEKGLEFKEPVSR